MGLCEQVLSAVRETGEVKDALNFLDDDVITAVTKEVQADCGFTSASLTVRGDQFASDANAGRQFTAMLSLSIKQMQSMAEWRDPLTEKSDLLEVGSVMYLGAHTARSTCIQSAEHLKSWIQMAGESS